MRPALLLLGSCLLLACAQAPHDADREAQAAMPPLGSFPLDPVMLLAGGEELAGDTQLHADHGPYRYHFISENSREVFRSDPERYAIRLGGACARMGALSGVGNPEIWAVHNGRLYLFASAGCRTGFLADPDRFLDPGFDQPQLAGLNEALLAELLLGRALEWLGGPEVVDERALRWELEETVRAGETPHEHRLVIELGPGPRYRKQETWDDRTWVQEFDGDQGFLGDPAGRDRALVPAQRWELERKAFADLLLLFQQRGDPELQLAAEGADRSGVAVLHLWLRGMTHELGIHQETGEIHWHIFRGRGPDAVFGQFRRVFTRWEQHRRLRVPVAWEQAFDGQVGAPVDRPAAGWRLTVLRP